MEELTSRKVKPQLVGTPSSVLPMEDCISCSVWSLPLKRILRMQEQSNNTAELSSIIEALSFLGPNGLVARDSLACIFYDSKHAASVCLGANAPWV